MEIRKGTLKDLEAIAAVEAACFPAAEAATAEEFAGRLQQYGDHFWLLWEGERLLAFVDGFCTDWPEPVQITVGVACQIYHSRPPVPERAKPQPKAAKPLSRPGKPVIIK